MGLDQQAQRLDELRGARLGGTAFDAKLPRIGTKPSALGSVGEQDINGFSQDKLIAGRHDAACYAVLNVIA